MKPNYPVYFAVTILVMIILGLFYVNHYEKSLPTKSVLVTGSCNSTDLLKYVLDKDGVDLIKVVYTDSVKTSDNIYNCTYHYEGTVRPVIVEEKKTSWLG